MIEVVFYTDAREKIRGFLVRGHAGYAPAGRDIVCAGVSALVQTAVRGLEEYLSQPPEVRRKRGLLRVFLPCSLGEEDAERAAVILGTLELGLREIACLYKKHVRVRRCREDDEQAL